MNKELYKTAKNIIVMVTIQNILVTAAWVVLAIAFDKWWISLFSLITFKNIPFKVPDGDKND